MLYSFESITPSNKQTASPPIIDQTVENTTLLGLQYYCTSEGCGFYQNGVCLDCDVDNNGVPDEMFDPRDPGFEGCDEPGLLCSGGVQIPQGVILRPCFALNATGFSVSNIPGYNDTYGYSNQIFGNATSYDCNLTSPFSPYLQEQIAKGNGERWVKKPQKALPQQYITVLEFVLGST